MPQCFFLILQFFLLILNNPKNQLESISSCDLPLWLNYRNVQSKNRLVIKKCDKNKANGYNCEGCTRTVKTNQTKALNTFSWTLVANFESKMLNYLNEHYLIDIKTSFNNSASSLFAASKLRPFWQNVTFPSVEVKCN